MAVTNQLEIDIKGKSDKATQSLDTLIAKLNEVNSALNGLNTNKINEISNSIKGLKGVHVNTGTSGIGGSNSGTNKVVSQNNRATSSFQKLLNAVSGTNKGMLSFSGTMANLAAKWGMFYASMYPLIRLFKFFGKEIESAMDYTETYNYFKVTMGKIGHDAGEEFSNDFMEQLTDLNKKMTGFKLGANGELLETGENNLGIDPSVLMQFQANIGAITNSVGLLGKTSLTTQKALSMLASDFSSLKNEDLDQVMKKMTSGLIGQSRAWYSYGIDITQASLKQLALEHGITKSVSAMSQAEKMQLRLLMAIEKGRVAWGDQANTITSVANQYRMLKQQLANLGRVLGNLFLPIINTVLPYVNALVIVLRRLFTMLGFKLHGDNWLKDVNDGISSGNFDDMADGIEDTSDALDDATKSAKKFKQATMGFDELNIISPDTSSGGGSGKGSGVGGGFDLSDDIDEAFKKYEDTWNEAFDRMNYKAQELASKFMSYVEASDWWGLGRWMSDGLASQIEKVNWTRVYSGASQFGTGLAQFLNGLISPRLFYDVGETIANSLNTAILFALNFGKTFDFANLGKSIGNGINGFFENYKFSELAQTLNVWVDGLETAFITALKTINWKAVFKGLYDFVSNIELDTVGVIIGILAIKKIGALTIKKAITEAIAKKIIGGISSAFAVDGVIGGLWIKLLDAIAGGFSIGNMTASMTAVFGETGFAIITGIAGGIIGFGVSAIVSAIETKILEALGFAEDDLKNGKTGAKVGALGGLVIGGIVTAITGGAGIVLIPAIMGIGTIIGETIGANWTKIKQGFDKLSEDIKTKGFLTVASDMITGLKKSISEVPGKIKESCGKLGAKIGKFAANGITSFSEWFKDLPDRLKKAWDSINIVDLASKLGKGLGTVIAKSIKLDIDFAKFIASGFSTSAKFFTGLPEFFAEMNKKCLEELKKVDWSNIGKNILAGILDIFSNIQKIKAQINIAIANFFKSVYEGICEEFEIHSPSKKMMPLGEYIFLGLLEGFTSKFEEWKIAITNWYNNDVSPWFTKDKWLALGSGIKDGLSEKWTEFSTWWQNTGIVKWWTEDVTPWFTKEKWNAFGENIKKSLTEKWNAFVEWWSSTGIYTWWTDHVEPYFTEDKWNFEGIKKGLTQAWKNAITSIKVLWNKFADWLNEAMTIHIDAKSIGDYKLWDAQDITLAKVPKFSIPQYAIGGFPEDGLFMANHNELVGQFSNGQTAVANNEQIVEGIKSGVASAVSQTLAPYLRDIVANTGDTANNTDAIAKKPVQSITDRGIAKANLRGQRSLGLQLRTT